MDVDGQQENNGVDGMDMDMDRQVALPMDFGAGMLDNIDMDFQINGPDDDQQQQPPADQPPRSRSGSQQDQDEDTPDGTPSLKGLKKADIDAIAAAAEKHAKQQQARRKRKKAAATDDDEGDDQNEDEDEESSPAPAPARKPKKKGRQVRGGALVDKETMLTAEELKIMRDSYDENLKKRQEEARKVKREKEERERAMALVYGVPAWSTSSVILSARFG